LGSKYWRKKHKPNTENGEKYDENTPQYEKTSIRAKNINPIQRTEKLMLKACLKTSTGELKT
jgi:hypothetical protein